MRPELERRLAVVVEPLERAVLDGVREFEAEPDRVRVELGLVPVFVDERPLLGLAGLIDWRASGRLSAMLRSSFFSGAAGEQLLTPGERRWPVDRLVLVGCGSRAEFDEARARELAARCVEIAAGLSAESVVIALPAKTIDRELVELAFESLLEAIDRAASAQAHEHEPERPADLVAETAVDPTVVPAAVPEERAAEERALDREPDDREKHAISSEEPASPPAAGGEGESSDTDEALDEPATPQAEPLEAAPEARSAEQPAPERGSTPALESQQEGQPEPVSRAEARWWVVVDEAVVARLRRVRSGPPRAARGGSSLYT